MDGQRNFGGKKWVVCGAVLAAISVILGAFGAHGLKDWLPEQFPDDFEKRLANWETGARYQMYHALGLVIWGVCVFAGVLKESKVVPGLLLVGVLCFSGSLYALALTNLKFMGAIAPIGGTSWIVAWAVFAWKAAR